MLKNNGGVNFTPLLFVATNYVSPSRGGNLPPAGAHSAPLQFLPYIFVGVYLRSPAYNHFTNYAVRIYK